MYRILWTYLQKKAWRWPVYRLKYVVYVKENKNRCAWRNIALFHKGIESTSFNKMGPEMPVFTQAA